jgi:hypothetical protein
MGISPHGRSVGQPAVGSSNRDFVTWLKVALELGHWMYECYISDLLSIVIYIYSYIQGVSRL